MTKLFKQEKIPKLTFVMDWIYTMDCELKEFMDEKDN